MFWCLLLKNMQINIYLNWFLFIIHAKWLICIFFLKTLMHTMFTQVIKKHKFVIFALPA